MIDGPLPIMLEVLRQKLDCAFEQTTYFWMKEELASSLMTLDNIIKQVQRNEEPKYTTGHCKEHAKPGGCQLHNLQCGYPECDRKLV